ncbi:MAG TPA: TonB-dependent receptor [Arenimonas sp.]|uniref:TonB-dependent receptor n=1 Tax=Arenimonas sp. TaxID=1872635 RepID=UPI002D7F3FCA|nr:TonB-dependent receptor [Arenimonas sp.]HEU0153426.1 TonB-dependent receptor [Arenimonas sp.]
MSTPTPTSRRLPALRLVSLAIASLLASTAPLAQAADAVPADAPDGADRATRLDGVEVTGERLDKPSSPKYTEALLDTPQTITVVDKDTMDQQGLVSLREILTTLPGITFGAGEGGGGYGDSINLRGFSANADLTVDGVRDSAQYSRTDNFNLESLELVNGANSVHSGAGSVGGNINLVSKAAMLEDFSAFTVGAGTDGYGRLTADANQRIGEQSALRLNAMVHENDVPGRDFERFERWGFAPSLGLGLDSDTRLTLSALVQRDDNVPQYGVPYFPAYGGLLPGADVEGYYGYHNIDRQEIANDTVTAVLEHDFNADLSLRSLVRYQRIEQTTVVDAVQGTWCLADGTNPATGAACASPGTYQPSGPRGLRRDTENRLFASQTDLTARFDTGAVGHALVAGVAFTRETFDLATGNVLRNADGSPVPLPVMDLARPDSRWTGPVNYFRTGKSAGTLENQAIYVFDTLTLSPRWRVNLGARYERNQGVNTTWQVKTYSSDAGADNSGLGQLLARNPDLRNDEDLFSWRSGLVFKPADNGSVYLSYSTSLTPSKASVNGACRETTCNVEPEEARNLELGTKWEVLDGHLALSAALFRNERVNYKVADFDPANPSGEQQLDGQARVDGLALGLAGQLTARWSIFANATLLDSEVLQSVSDYCLANPGLNGCTNTPANPDPERGQRIVNTPEESASVWTTFAFAPGWTAGYGLSYQGPFDGGRVEGVPDVKGYTTHRAMLSWTVNDTLALQLNANNLFDKQYFTRVRNNGWATPGEARSLVLSASVRF